MLDTLRISEEEREALITGDAATFPKYTTQLMNTSNQNAQATRPNDVETILKDIERATLPPDEKEALREIVREFEEELDGDRDSSLLRELLDRAK